MSRKGFTLIELLVVVAVLALLASIVFSNLGGAREGARISNALSFQSQTHSLLGSDLVGWWNFNDPTARYKDLSGYDNHGSCSTNCPTVTDGVSGTGGTALEFNGSDSTSASRVNTSLVYERLNEYTLSAWVYRRSTRAFQFMVGGHVGNNISMGINAGSSERFRFYTYDGSDKALVTSSVGSFPLNAWTHLLISVRYTNMDGSVVSGNGTLYANGEEVGFGQFSNVTTYNRNLLIGSPGSNTLNRAFEGTIDDVRIYSRALTASEIQTLYTQTKDNYLANE